MTDVLMSRQRPAQIVEERFETEGVGNRVVFSFNDLSRELAESIERFIR